MSNASDDRLKKIFQKLRNYEAPPSERSWESIQSKLPSGRGGISGVVSGAVIMLFLLTAVLFRSTSEIENHSSDLIRPKRAFSELSKPNQTNTKALYPKKSVPTPSAKSQNVRESESWQNPKPGRIGPVGVNKPEEIYDTIRSNPDSVRQEQPNFENHRDNVLTKTIPTDLTQFEQPLTEAALTRFDSLVRELNKSVQGAPHDSARQINKQRPLSGFAVVRVTPFYNSGVFIPLLEDAVRVGQFSQSKNLMKNRLGLLLEVGYHSKIFDKIDIEYFAGYKVFSKEMQYTTTVVTEERTTKQSIHKVSATTHILRAGVAIRPSFQPAIFSIAYEKAFGDFTTHSGSQLISFGLGAERKINNQISVRPGISYGISIDGNVRHFNYRPIGWNLEIAWRLDTQL